MAMCPFLSGNVVEVSSTTTQSEPQIGGEVGTSVMQINSETVFKNIPCQTTGCQLWNPADGQCNLGYVPPPPPPFSIPASAAAAIQAKLNALS